jgi:hypothetical protein
MTTANKIVRVEDRVERAKGLLLTQFKDKTNINKVVEALVEEIQELDNAVVDLQMFRTLDDAQGVNLTEIGNQLKVPRDNLGDEDYRTAIKVKVLRSKSAGTENDVAEVIRLLLSDPSATITKPHPYTVEIAAFLGCIGDTSAGIRQLSQFIPLNSNTRIIAKKSGVFCFAGGDGLGFSSYGGASGGKIASLVYSDYGVSQRPNFTTYTAQIPPVIIANPPILVAAPEVTGSVVIGSILSTSNGAWQSELPLTYAYQWFRDGVPINGENTNTYTTTTDDQDSGISCRVSAINAAGNVSALSNTIIIFAVDPEESGILVTNIPVNIIEKPTTSISDGDIPVTATAELIFLANGTYDKRFNGVSVETGDFLATTGAGAGDNFTITYQKLNGVDLVTPTVLAEIPLTSDILYKQKITVNRDFSVGGNYRVFIHNKVQNLTEYVDIYIGCEIKTTLQEPEV